MATVSVVIPCLDAEPFIEDALKSALGQTFGDIEVIAVDDASTDGTRSILRHYAEVDYRVRPLFLDRQSGPSGARNAGIAASTAPWIALLDADDLFRPERIETLLQNATDDLDIIADDQIVVSFPGNLPLHEGFVFLEGHEYVDIDLEYYIRNSLVAPHSLRPGRGLSTGYLKPMIRRRFLDKTGVRYDERYRMAEDFLFYFESLARGARLRMLAKPMYVYRRPARSMTRSGQWALDAIIQLNRDIIARYADRISASCLQLLIVRQKHFETEREFVASMERLRKDRSAAAMIRASGHFLVNPPLLAMAFRAGMQRLGRHRLKACTPRLPT